MQSSRQLCLLLLAAAFFFSPGQTRAAACQEWVNFGVAPPITGDWDMEMTYDEQRHVIVGTLNDFEAGRVLTFTFNGQSWSRALPANMPPGPRFSYDLVYHPVRKTVLLYGGYVGVGTGVSQNDLWEWNGTTWTEVPKTGAWPPAAGTAKLAYDSNRDRVIALINDPGTLNSQQTWEWTGSAWERGPNLAPTSAQDFVFDRSRGRGFVYAQEANGDFQEMWEYLPGETAAQGAWQKVQGADPRTEMSIGARMVYDPYRRQIVRYGGRGAINIYGYTGTTFYWNAAELKWEFFSIAGPSAFGRVAGAMAFNTDSGETILYGGIRVNRGPPVTTETYTDTWRLIRREPGIVNEPAARASWCPGGRGILSVTHAGGVGIQWYKDAVAIPGATGSILFIDNVKPEHAGLYDVIISNDCGEIYSRATRVTVTIPPTITEQPSTEPIVCPEETMIFYGPKYEGTSPMTVRLEQKISGTWRQLDAEYQFLAGRFFFSIRNANPTNSGVYRINVSNECGVALTEEMPVQVGLSIVSHPSNATAQVCGAAEFAASGYGIEPLHFQWRLDGKPLENNDYFSGVQTARLKLTSILYEHEGLYDVVISDSCDPPNVVTSHAGRLTVLPGPQWVLRATNGPTARALHSLTYDPTRALTTLFGGATNSGFNDRVPMNDLWEWNGARWIRRQTNDPNYGFVLSDGRWLVTYGDKPVRRAGHVMTYDLKRKRHVLFGGYTMLPNGPSRFLNDLWEWDGYRWYFRSTNGPVPRTGASMAYDPNRGVTVLVGGFKDGAEPVPGAVWEWNGENWMMRAPETGGPATNYSQDIGSMVYDDFRKLMIFGPTVGETSSWVYWAWDGRAWRRLTTTFPGQLTYIKRGANAFDSHRRRTVHFGGHDSPPSNLTASFDTFTWELINSAVKPAPRDELPMAYDSARRAMVLFGGNLAQGGFVTAGDTWELVSTDRPLINEQPASQYRQKGETATFTVSAVPEGFSVIWVKDSLPLSDSDRVQGANTSTLRISNVTESDAGIYIAVLSNNCGMTTSIPAVLTLKPDLQIFAGSNTSTILWADPAVVLEEADDPTGPWRVVEGATSPFTPGTSATQKYFRLRAL